MNELKFEKGRKKKYRKRVLNISNISLNMIKETYENKTKITIP